MTTSSVPSRSVFAALGLFAAAPLFAQSTGIVSVNPTDYSVTDRLTDISIVGGYSVHQGQLHYWAGNSYGGGSTTYQIYDIAGGSLVSSTPVSGISMVSNSFGDPFGLYNSANNTFYVGTYAGSGSGLYSYNRTTSTWSGLGVFESLYAAAAHNGRIYASGLNAIWLGGSNQANQIALYDLTGNSSHDVVIAAAGPSAGVAVDHLGNVYYADYNGAGTSLYKWTSAQIDSVTASLGHGDSGGGEDDFYLTYDDAQLLTNLPAGANGIEVDAAGNVFVTVNDFGGGPSGLLMWNEGLGFGDGDFYQFLATNDSNNPYPWFGDISIEGDFLAGDPLYVSLGTGLAEIRYLGAIPEPAAFASLAGALALVGAALRRRRR